MLQFASLTGFIRTILIVILVWYGVKILSRIFAPILLRYVSKKAQQKYGQQFNQYKKPPQANQNEGEISIDKMPNQNKTSNKDVGEYVDYEEID